MTSQETLASFLPSATAKIQPVLVIAGIIIDHKDIPSATEDFVSLKRKLFPNTQRQQYLDSILPEIKGSDVRKNASSSSRNKRRHSFKLLDEYLDLLNQHQARIIGRSWIKGINTPFNGSSIYTYSVQSMFKSFQHYLEETDDVGIFIVDSRTHQLNRQVSHSIFTQKFKQNGDDFDRVVDLPTFAVSDNHAGLQLADLLCSALLFPITVYKFCTGHVNNLHVRPGYARLHGRYASGISGLQHRYQDAAGRWTGGIIVSDNLAQRSGSMLFQ